jgi:hypothetical protein
MKIRLLITVLVSASVVSVMPKVRVNCGCTLFLSRIFSCSSYEFLLIKVFNEAAKCLANS